MGFFEKCFLKHLYDSSFVLVCYRREKFFFFFSNSSRKSLLEKCAYAFDQIID